MSLCPFHALEVVEGEVRQIGNCYLCGVCMALCEEKAITLIPKLEIREIKPLRDHNHRS